MNRRVLGLGITVTLATMALSIASVTAGDSRGCTIRGTSGADVIEGTSGADVICAGGGKDVIRANPVQAGDSILVATEKGYVIAVRDAQRGCSWPSGTPQSAVYTTPVVSGDKIYVIQMSGQVYTLDATALETGVCAANLLYAPPEGD